MIMGTIWVNVIVLVNEEFVTMFKNVKIVVESTSNKHMNEAFETQHPRLLKKIPTYTDKRGFGSRAGFECEVIREKGDWAVMRTTVMKPDKDRSRGETI